MAKPVGCAVKIHSAAFVKIISRFASSPAAFTKAVYIERAFCRCLFTTKLCRLDKPTLSFLAG